MATSNCVDKILDFIHKQNPNRHFYNDLQGALARHANELPCKPSKADVEALQALFTAGWQPDGGWIPTQD